MSVRGSQRTPLYFKAPSTLVRRNAESPQVFVYHPLCFQVTAQQTVVRLVMLRRSGSLVLLRRVAMFASCLLAPRCSTAGAWGFASLLAMSSASGRRRSANRSSAMSTSYDDDATECLPPIGSSRKPSLLDPDAMQHPPGRRGSSASSHSHGLTPEATSPRVIRFSSSEVMMYANWFRVDVDTTKHIVMQCKGNRDAIVAALERHSAIQQPEEAQRPPQTPEKPCGGPAALMPQLPAIVKSGSASYARRGIGGASSSTTPHAEDGWQASSSASPPPGAPRRAGSSRGSMRRHNNADDDENARVLARQSSARLSASRHHGGRSSTDFTIGGTQGRV